MNLFVKNQRADNLWRLLGSFGRFDTETTVQNDSFSAQNDAIQAVSHITRYENGVCVRRGSVKNISSRPQTLNTLASRFTLNGGEYQVYTQCNAWQNESQGNWQPLITSVSAKSESVRTASGAAPFAVLWSEQENRGTAFHLIPNSAWEITVLRDYLPGENSQIQVELGVLKDALALELQPGEEIPLPEILYYEVCSRTDLDCWKLHSYMNRQYPVKRMPVVYNSWLYKFDRFTYDDIILQAEKAAELGVEYFVIDAGWFGEGAAWWPARGDWEENQTFGFRGRMAEAARKIRDMGIKFGFWLEPECASQDSKIVQSHPEYFVKGEGDSCFLDFANPDAVTYIYEKTCSLVDRYGAEYMKFDFNADLEYDKYNTGFLSYYRGMHTFLQKLRERYPDLYIQNCASGGMTMTLSEAMRYDSFWPTDNQSPYASLRIFKDTLLRMPFQRIDSWLSVASAENFSYVYETGELTEKLFATNDATWSNVVSVEDSFVEAFLKGRVMGLSLDLTRLSDRFFAKLKEIIKQFKTDREFYSRCVCRILADTETMLVLQYSDEQAQRAEILVFSHKCKQDSICVHPVVDKNCSYILNDVIEKTAAQIQQTGIEIPVAMPYTVSVVRLQKK